MLTREDFAARREAAENAKKAGKSCSAGGFVGPICAMICHKEILQSQLIPPQARLQNAPKALGECVKSCLKIDQRSFFTCLLPKVLASAQKNLTDFPVLRHLAMREEQSTWFVGFVSDLLPHAVLTGMWVGCKVTTRSWCVAASSAPSSSSETKIIVARTGFCATKDDKGCQ